MTYNPASRRWQALSLVLLVLGTEFYLRVAHQGQGLKWLFAVIAVLGLILLGLLPSPTFWSGAWWRLSAILAYSLYLTFSAFGRFRGLAKDIEPSAFNIASYFAKIGAALAATLIFLALARLFISRHSFRKTPSGPAICSLF